MNVKNSSLKFYKSNKKQSCIINIELKGEVKTENNKYSKLLAILPLSYIILYVITFPTNVVPLLRASVLEGITIPYPLNIGVVLFLCGMPLIPFAIILILKYIDL